MTTNIGLSRSFGRDAATKRPCSIIRHYQTKAAGSCLIMTGETRVLCTVSIEEKVKPWRRGSGLGWITAEYAMLPASCGKRTQRERANRQGRSMEIERLIGRSLRAAVDMSAMGGETTFYVDCDVIEADGGTRTASITGAWVALYDAFEYWIRAGKIRKNPITSQVAAISVGQVAGQLLCDLDYQEDSAADVDMNVVMNSAGEMIEIQGTGEQATFSRATLNSMLDLAQAGIEELMAEQRRVLGI